MVMTMIICLLFDLLHYHRKDFRLNWRFLNLKLFLFYFPLQWWSFIPIMVTTWGSFPTNHLKRTVVTVYTTPVMINTIFISRTHFLHVWPLAPVMIQTVRTVLTHYFLMVAFPLHFCHILNIFFCITTALAIWTWSHTCMCMSMGCSHFCDCRVSKTVNRLSH